MLDPYILQVRKQDSGEAVLLIQGHFPQAPLSMEFSR